MSVIDVCGDLIEYFNLKKALNNILVPASSLYDQAKEYLIKDEYYKAKKIYEQIVSIYPQMYYGWLGLLLCETKKFKDSTPDKDIIKDYYSKVINTIDDNYLQNTLINRFDNYKSNITQYANLFKEQENLIAQDALVRSTIQSAKKDRTKYMTLAILL